MKKSITKVYVEYFKDNPKGYWFKRKIYGWGWVPVKWQGWAFLLIWMGLFIQFIIKIDDNSRSEKDTLIAMILPMLFFLALLFLICYGTGEKPKWSWGK